MIFKPQTYNLLLRNIRCSVYQTCRQYSTGNSIGLLNRNNQLYNYARNNKKISVKHYGGIYNVNTKVVKDVVLYKYDNPKFFKILNIFALCQFGFWVYLSHFAYTTLKDIPIQSTNENDPWWRKANLGGDKYRRGITFISFFMGYAILAGAWMFSLKSVRYLILRKGGDAITFVTYGPFGKNRLMTVGLQNISCKDTRQTAKTYLPIKVQNKFMHFILDMKGEFKNTKLFDYTAGLKRTFK